MREAIAIVERVLRQEQLRMTETEVAALLRDENIGKEEVWLRAENFGLAVVSNLESRVDSFEVHDVDGISEELLTLAAHVLWTASQRRHSLEDVYEAVFLGLNASIAFLYAANVSGAVAVVREMQDWRSGDVVFEAVKRTIQGMNFLPDVSIPRETPVNLQLQSYFQGWLRDETPMAPDMVNLMVEEVRIDERQLSPAQLAIIYRFEQSIPWLAQWLLPSAVEGFLGMKTSYVDNMRDRGPFFGFPSQMRGLHQLAGVGSGNTLITFPTSTGKTFLGQLLAIEPILKGKNGIAVYIAPYRAIVTQIMERERHNIESAGISIVKAMGGYMEGLEDLDSFEKVFLVSTPEAFDYALRVKPDMVRRLVSVVVDEMHIIEQPGRGTLMECLLGRVRDLQKRVDIRIIGLSAVLTDTSNIQEWLSIPDDRVLRTEWTPARKRFEVQTNQNRAYFYGSSSVKDDIDAKMLRWRYSSGVRKIPYKDDPRRKDDQDRAYDAIAGGAAYMAVAIHGKYRGPVLVICSSKGDTRTIARKLLNYTNVDAQANSRLASLENMLINKYPHHKNLLRMIPYRVCYHNADLEYDVRELLEKLIEDGYFKVVVSTTTLAEGVDLPFRSVIMYRWTSNLGKGRRRLFSTLLVRNISGRCGRAARFVEGDTIFFDNPADDEMFGGDRRRQIETDYIRPGTVLLDSSIEQDTSIVSLNIDIVSQIESSLLALIAERQSVESPTEQMLGLLLCKPRNTERHGHHLNQIIDEELSRVDKALIRANSPVQLTDLGRAAMQTGLSVRSASTIARSLEQLVIPMPNVSRQNTIATLGFQWNGFYAKAMAALQELHELDYLRRGVVNKTNQPLIAWGWFSGWSTPAILWVSQYRKLSAEDEIIRWLINPEVANDALEDGIAELQGYCDNFFKQRWVKVLRSVRTMLLQSDIGDKEDFAEIYRVLVDYVKYGVSRQLAVELLRDISSFPGNRTAAQIVAEWYELRGVLKFDDLLTVAFVPSPANLREIILDPQGVSRLRAETAVELCNWILDIRRRHAVGGNLI